MTEWRNDGMTEWRSDGVIKWWNDDDDDDDDDKESMGWHYDSFDCLLLLSGIKEENRKRHTH